ncbi:hypothetical protein EJD97_011312 [Solanum chilense]|uniref:Uncharacterized protein n=1 Tax=Solanum chilense TaxID=4083 RepID=A0A6N2BFY7_SOLCI|nr:hypothetical protein EJD97_011312 [Solanum chilense]
MLSSEFDIVYVTQKAIKAHALADHLAENPIDEEYEQLKNYFHDEEVLFVGEDISESCQGWRLFFDIAANHQGRGIGAVLVEILYRRTPDLGDLRSVDAVEVAKLIEQIRASFCGTHMNGLTFGRKILRAGFEVTESIITDNGENLNKEVIPTEVEIPSLRIIQGAELSNAEWVNKRIDQLTLIAEKRMIVVCYDEYNKKFTPNWQGPYNVCKVLSGGAFVLSKMDSTA